MTVRVIAKLDVKPPYVVKPVHFEGLRRMGDPSEMAKKYYEQGADELFYIDIVSSLYRRDILEYEIEKVANNLLIPFAVGGGIKDISDCAKVLQKGADKVVINTFAVQEDPSIIDRLATLFGSQAVVVNVEAKRWDGSWQCYTDCGRIQSSKNVFDWVSEAEQRGAGEILLQSVDKDGRCKGFELELASKVVESLDIPVVVSSGAGSLEDIKLLVEECKPSGVAIASLLHYDRTTIEEIKKYLNKKIVSPK